MEFAVESIKGLGRMFYIVSPQETSFPTIEHLPKPDYVTKAVPYFLTLIFLENLILWLKKKPTARINDGIVSLSHGIFLGCGQLLVRGIESYVYIKIYDNWRLYELSWDSAYTWYAAALLTDLGYYWLHRSAHEINFFWAQHQVHHSSEDYNLTTALRQSAFQGWFGWVFYLPMAFFIPPSVYLIHQQFNLLFQFWIHTELVDSLGPLEYVLNTPRHHRIHHGSNRYCLDKNYAGALIIWDRMFGTFAETKPGETIVYGLVEEVNSFNPLWLQFFYYSKIREKVDAQTERHDKLSSMFKGPGWFPGKPRLGDPNDVPEVPARVKYDVKIPLWQSIYAVVHFTIVLIGFDILSRHNMDLNQWNVTLCVSFVLYSLTSIGLILDGKKRGAFSELFRCSLAMFIPSYLKMSSLGSSLVFEFFTLSIFAMIYRIMFTDNVRSKASEGDDGSDENNDEPMEELNGHAHGISMNGNSTPPGLREDKKVN